jgi:tetratricopeptide (TPR) repeat protein
LSAANAALQSGQADKALSLLHELPAPDGRSAEANNLTCRVLFTLEQWDAAGSACEQAVNLDPRNSDYHLWLGRALGERADKASFVTAYNLAKRARAEFEQATQLNPRNAEALADLGEFYNSAPGVVGGGTAKAENVAAELDRVDPARAHELRAFIAEDRKDYATADREFRQALAVSKHPAFQWTRLASFYRRIKRWDEMETALKNCMAAAQRDRTAGVALFNGASVLIKANRDPELAIKLLEAYVAAPTKTEEAPVFVADVWLARLKAQTGDLAGARRDRAAALSLASQYKPAQDLKI